MSRRDVAVRGRWFVGVVALLCAQAAWAQPATPCTINPTFGVTVVDGGTALPGFISNGFDAFESWTVGAQPSPGASCSNMTRGYSIAYGPFGGSQGGTFLPNIGGNGDVDSATATLSHVRMGSYMFKGTFSCVCGTLGGPSQDVTVSPVLVPPAITSQPTVLDTNVVTAYTGADPLPVGHPLRLSVGIDSAMCANEHVTYTLSGAGVSKSVDVAGTADCSDASADATIDFTPTQTGQLKLVATFFGVSSNTVTWSVTDQGGGTGGGSGSGGGSGGGASGGGTGESGTGGDSGGTKKGGCASAPIDPLVVAGAVLVAFAARRRR